MKTDPPELGKGLFGYRKSAVNQILADRDVMLRQAAGRVRPTSNQDDAAPSGPPGWFAGSSARQYTRGRCPAPSL